jgi:TadE-like protein
VEQGAAGRQLGKIVRGRAELGEPGRRGERGATLVEFALVVPLLLLLVFGIIEYGFAFNADSNVNQSARAGGRAAAILSTDPQMEFDAAEAAATALSISPSSISGQPQVCVGPVQGTDTNPCDNPYTEILTLVHQGTPNSPLWAVQVGNGPVGTYPATDAWPVAIRKFGCPATGGVYDKVAVRVSIQHKLIIPGLFSVFFGNSNTPTISATSIFQLEPVPSTSC